MELPPVTERRLEIAKAKGLVNVDKAAVASRQVGLPFWAACALLSKESGGRNVWGGSDASPFVELARNEVPITRSSFAAFYVGVKAGLVPTGVGPCQITYAGALKNGVRDGGYFRLMEEQGLKPWLPFDNMVFGFRTLWDNYQNSGHSWVNAGRLYNGSRSYGEDLLQECIAWKDDLGVKGPINP